MTGVEAEQEFDFDFLFEFKHSDEGGGGGGSRRGGRGTSGGAGGGMLRAGGEPRGKVIPLPGGSAAGGGGAGEPAVPPGGVGPAAGGACRPRRQAESGAAAAGSEIVPRRPALSRAVPLQQPEGPGRGGGAGGSRCPIFETWGLLELFKPPALPVRRQPVTGRAVGAGCPALAGGDPLAKPSPHPPGSPRKWGSGSCPLQRWAGSKNTSGPPSPPELEPVRLRV